jgi:HTH-type transcriptional regulator / antitoxin HigA
METVIESNYVARPIKTEEQYDEALAFIDTLMDCKAGTPEMDTLEVVGILIHDYEQRVHPILAPNPVEAIKYQMEELGVTTTEMAALVGGKGRLSELFHGKRRLSLGQIKAIATRLDIPANILLEIA